MKLHLSLIAAAVLALSACGGESQPAPAAAPAPASAPAVAASIPEAMEASPVVEAAAPMASEECSVVISGDDQMKFDAKEINIKSSCAQYTVTLKHTGQMAAAAMGHNIVIAKSADKDGVVADGMTAGLEANYVKADDARVVASTKLIGGGEEASVTFDVSKLAKDGSYEFFCTFPGHTAMMNGKINIVE